MSTLADVVEHAASEIARRADVPPDLAADALRELVRSLREPREPELASSLDAHALARAMKLLGTATLDVIERDASASDVRLVAEWFSAVSARALGDANRRLVAMLDALDDHVILLDTDARVRFLNRSAGATAHGVYGRTREEMIGRSVIDGDAMQAHKQYVLGLVERARAGETVADEFLLPLPGGAIWHEHHFQPVRDADGAIDAVAIASREIHARKQAEGRLQLLSKIGLLAGASDFEGVLARAASFAIPELADWTVFQLVAAGETKCATVAHPDAERAAAAERALRRAAPRHVAAEPARIVRPDAELAARDPELHALLRDLDATTAIVVPFVVLGAPIAIATFGFGPESGRHHADADLAVADEIARRAAQIVENARLHAELARSLAHRERVMGILGHDLRNPVSAVLSLSATLAQRADIPERSKEGLRHIRQSAERMDEMIATILDVTQLRFRGLPPLALQSFELGGLARTIVDELRAANPARDIALDASGDSRGRWDPSRMGQVVSNLVGNALVHGAREAPVVVRVTAEGDSVTLAVTNRGPEIPSAQLARLFDAFWQAPGEGSATRARGLGLGLYIAHKIVQAHRGDIAVDSRDGQTTFAVRVPR